MPVPAFTTSLVRSRPAAANGRRASASLWPRKTPEAVAKLLSPYLEVVRALNESDRLRVYPGSPALARAWLRPQDRLLACELEPKTAAALRRNLRGDVRIKTLAVDGWTALNAYVPPKERRGLVLVDPPFEAENGFSQLASGLAAAHRKWATGVYVLWYPIKGRSEADAFAETPAPAGAQQGAPSRGILLAPLSDPSRLNGAGMVIVNPPWRLENELCVLLPVLASILGEGTGKFRLDWLAGEEPSAPQ